MTVPDVAIVVDVVPLTLSTHLWAVALVSTAVNLAVNGGGSANAADGASSAATTPTASHGRCRVLPFKVSPLSGFKTTGPAATGRRDGPR